ncbi:MAG: tRNA uridine-5-carboxymethylaminomethyl(34) synthesis enzyme MnmG [Candidatus Omnitrophica bacterium]|nr:tRNA uridine-5-carboxymethylaminomethyl(34) synthesis enzyme MnmG [Candidatus Omnitrophota bacterium]
MKEFQCVVIGAGHAGVEAALVAARMGCQTAMVTLSKDTIGQMSCNPAIGGVGKGQLVKEIDALGGEIGLAADRTGIQFRQLNASKGQAVRSSRCQSDRKLYKQYMQKVIATQENLTVIEDQATEVLVKGREVCGLKTAAGLTIETQTIVIAAGTFLRGRMHMGPQVTEGGRAGEISSLRLADSLESLGFEILSFKTGTPPRLDASTIDFSKMEVQHSDTLPAPFSFRTKGIPHDQKLLPCHITHTTEKTHDIIRANMHLSPMYSGQIQATGVRYCPSIEDKIKKFSDKLSHHVFLEPEGLDSREYYPNGISTGLPRDVQEQIVRSIPGLENAKMTQPGYSIEHGVILPTELRPYLETKKNQGLFLAGQINGTTGYEEAAAQGMMAGINAALKVQGKEPFILGREEAYIGVLIDDLTTKGTDEPYRMFTSRVEYRLIAREDNADKRMAKYGYQFGLISDEEYQAIVKKYDAIDKEIVSLKEFRVLPSSSEGKQVNEILIANNSSPIRQPATLNVILKRPEVRYEMLSPLRKGVSDLSKEIVDQIEYEIKYEGFIERQLKSIEKFRHIENIKIPADIDYTSIPGISIEIQQKLKRFSPMTLGQANRISGVTPSAISILMVYLRKLSAERKGGV